MPINSQRLYMNAWLSLMYRSSFLNQGEVCLCISRLFVQSAIFDKFLEEFVAATK